MGLDAHPPHQTIPYRSSRGGLNLPRWMIIYLGAGGREDRRECCLVSVTPPPSPGCSLVERGYVERKRRRARSCVCVCVCVCVCACVTPARLKAIV